jgi:hypothetical protein
VIGMNTMRACAVIGLALSVGLASGCSSDSNSGTPDGSTRRDGGYNRDVSRYTNTDAAEGCTFDGTSYRVGQSFTIDCVTYTCQGNNNVTASGTACTDARASSPDTRPERDSGRPSDASGFGDAAVVIDGGGGGDVAATEAGQTEPDLAVPYTEDGPTVKLDAPPDFVTIQVDLPPSVPDLPPATDLPPGEDVTVITPDVAVPTQCPYGGHNYNPGEEFACDCNTCICTSTGAIRSLTSNVCDTDAG